jgi:hypothetical protein
VPAPSVSTGGSTASALPMGAERDREPRRTTSVKDGGGWGVESLSESDPSDQRLALDRPGELLGTKGAASGEREPVGRLVWLAGGS